ncbi:hypothetical protein PWK10_08930 [Caloramator sp. Dgby_cultured_2]|uniref:hypothetical protein n=1 Tax=Caloramator sp. Dgby_cultured_2 TaxID=3029174 RepID=UPI00237D9A67|nr:hypothetical protein [Caloramator sp. Dgby_cultured_2]WDU84364.1 hypothetical protein PWK10_08930 [Caloramator sp. Dgby_cultured_2]
MEDRIISSSLKPEDLDYEGSLRPKTLREYIGQEKVKERLKIFIEAAKKEEKPLTMFYFMDLLALERQPLQV